MFESLIFSLFYAVIVFAIGFIFGVIRTRLITPKIGKTRAVALELPFILCAAYFVFDAIDRHLAIQNGNRILIAALSFVILILLEFFTAHFLFKMSLAKFLNKYKKPDGVIGLIGQFAFALIALVA